MKSTVKVMEGSMAVAHAIRACKTDVIAAYPISPQTQIVEYLSDFAADGSLHGKYVNCDSEFSHHHLYMERPRLELGHILRRRLKGSYS